jgi:hypothetical protein
MTSAIEGNPPPGSGAVRLIFEYDGDDVRLVSQTPVDVAVTGFDLAQVPHPGRYVEVRSATEEAIGRVPVRGAFSPSTEVFPEQHGEPITRVDVERPQGAFTVIVPRPPTATRVSLVEVSRPEVEGVLPAAPATSATAGEPRIVEIASFDLEPSN